MNINYRVVGLDPGGTTGWFQYDAEYMPSLTGHGRGELIDHKVTHMHFGPEEHHDELYTALELSHIHDFYLVVESFEFRKGRQREGINLMSREYIGVASLFAQQRGLKKGERYIKYTAGQSKGFIPDKAVNGMPANAKLKAIPGFYQPGWKHANDAARVAANFLIVNHHRKDLIERWKDL